MPPMSSIRSFINAVKTGQTPTTRALERIAAVRTEHMRTALQRPGALNRPLGAAFRNSLRDDLDDVAITQCIDNWPDDHKERVRLALVDAVRDGRPIRFRWGLTAASEFETFIDDPGYGPITFTARTPQAQLSVYDGDQVNVPPVEPDAARGAVERAASSKRPASRGKSSSRKAAPGKTASRRSSGAANKRSPARKSRR